MQKNRTINNTIMLYLLTIAKLIFPLLTLPYLPRVLTTDCYGVVSYVKSCMVYFQLFVDFGFLLSAVKDIVQAKDDKGEIGIIAGQTFLAKLLIVAASAIVLIVLLFALPILREYTLYTILYFIAVAISALLAEFLFKGIEKMGFVTLVYVVMKGISTALTFVLVKDDGSIIWIPILEIIGNTFAVLLTWGLIWKLKIRIKIVSFKRSVLMLKESAVYFISNFATTAFGALNTVLIGVFITSKTQIAYWSVCLQLISAIQQLYSPIINGIYPQMIREKRLSFIHKIMLIFMPIVIGGCIFSFFIAKPALKIIAGEEYVNAFVLFRLLIPILLFSFPGMLYGWTTLGAIGKEKLTTLSTVITAIVQVIGLLSLALFRCFTVENVAILRCFTELLMMIIRISLTYKNRNLFYDKLN